MREDKSKNIVHLDERLKQKSGQDGHDIAKKKSAAEILKKHREDLRRFLNARLANHSDKDDIMQDVFMRLATHKELDSRLSYGDAKTRSYLMAIASNLIYDRYKHRKVRENAADYILQIQQDLVSDQSPESVTEANQTLEQVNQILNRLSPKCRQAFVLSRYHNLGYREIARQLNVSASMVEKYIAHALVALRVIMNSDEEVL